MRDQAHENAYAKALETLGVNWGATLPIPKTDAERFPEVKKLLDQGLHLKQYTFSADNLSEAGKIYQGTAPAVLGGGSLSIEQMPQGFPMDIARGAPGGVRPGSRPGAAQARAGHGRDGTGRRRRTDEEHHQEVTGGGRSGGPPANAGAGHLPVQLPLVEQLVHSDARVGHR